MRYFNAFQLMSLFICGPFIIQWVHSASFYAHNVVMWILIGGLVVGFGSLTVLVADNLEK